MTPFDILFFKIAVGVFVFGTVARLIESYKNRESLKTRFSSKVFYRIIFPVYIAIWLICFSGVYLVFTV